MEIAILTRGPGLYSTQSLYKACIAQGHIPVLVDYSRCSLLLGKEGAQIFYQDKQLHIPDGIIPRIGATFTQEGAALIRHFEWLKVPATLPSRALVQARDKLHSLQRLTKKGIDVPVTVMAEPGANIRLIEEQVGGFPCIVKALESTHGLGVKLVHTHQELKQVLETMTREEPYFVQEFIAESKGEDVRVLVVDGQVVGAMKRVAREGEFRSNLHQGGVAYNAKLTPLGEAVAIRAASALGLGVAGVDILESNRGPLVLEINASPGLEGIQKVTGQNIAGHIVRYMERLILEKDEEE
ncbi:MAG: RimK family alpha-L-glutamate ligase [Saprospiraceae bacterium]|nr:RimK family alpha-L-glutamate ligase [Saprospiraceae bacterium]